ncbi:MAG: hypothetical protein H6774_01965 [Pseudomonadales bacterium]|nr:hypothetical protein [Pseudomonadales bacterium]
MIFQTTINLSQEAAAQNLTGYDADPSGGMAFLIGRILSIAIVVGAVLLLLYLVWGGIEWIASGGDKGKLESARSKITQSIIGMIVLAGSVALFMLVQAFLGFQVLQFNFVGGSRNPGGNTPNCNYQTQTTCNAAPGCTWIIDNNFTPPNEFCMPDGNG